MSDKFGTNGREKMHKKHVIDQMTPQEKPRVYVENRTERVYVW
jgi:hypothetical protein